MDRVAYATGLVCPEGASALAAVSPGAAYERNPGGQCGNGMDSDINTFDFTSRNPANPRNLASPPAP